MVLEKIEHENDIKRINKNELPILAEEIRSFLIDKISKTGGHLASNLGVVELTMALHLAFDLPEDKIIWDVGHQSYTHKLLTGRKAGFDELRKYGGMSGFPKRHESDCDCFDTGHSSTSISAGLGYAMAREITGEKYKVISVIGDGALTGGMAYEALNNASKLKSNLIIVLNDNKMSISENVGGVSRYLSGLRTAESYQGLKNGITNSLNSIPKYGERIVEKIRKTKNGIKQLVIPGMLFENMGILNLGPVDGHNIEQLENILTLSKKVEGPVLIHVLTKKGKGYKIAEENPDKFHATAPFDINTGKSKVKKSADYSKVFGEKLVKLAKKNEKIVAITASMKDGTGLTKFKEEFPNRFFDIGIAEQHAITLAAGMAKEGIIPVVPIYSSFYQRAYDQVIHDVAIQNLPVIMCVDRAGLVGQDGETHQGTLDLAFFRLVPNLTIMAPMDFKELEDMLEFAVTLNKPVIIRYPRGGEGKTKINSHEKIKFGKAQILEKGADLTIVAIGKMVERAVEIAHELKKCNIEADVINARFLKPFDVKTVKESILKTKNIVTIEDGTKINGLGTTVKELIIDEKIEGVKFKQYAYPDEFIKHGKVEELEKIYGLDSITIKNDILKNI